MESIDAGTGTTRLGTGGLVTGGRVTRGKVAAGPVRGGKGVGLVLEVVAEPRSDPLLQAPPIARTARSGNKGLQPRDGRVDPRAMAEVEFYSDVPASPSQPDLAARVAELERVVATLASLRRERAVADRPDPVALTAALHPGGMRSKRNAKRRSSSDGTLPLRFVLFDPSASRLPPQE